MVKKSVPLQPVEDHGGADIHLQPAEDPCHARAGFLEGTVVCGGWMLEQSVPEELHPMERTPVGEVCEGLYPVGETSCWSRGRA